MLVCLACPKSANPHHLPTPHAQEDDDDLLSNKHPSSTGSRSEPIKSFTTQLKDIVLKFSSGAYRHCRPCTAAQGSDAHDHHTSHRQENDEEEEERSSILRSLTSEPSSEAQSPTYGQFGTNSSSTGAGRYDLLPVQHRKHLRRHHHHNRRHHHDLHRPRSRRHDSNSSASTPARPSSSSSSLNAHIEHQLRLMQQQQYQMQDTSSASPSRRPSSGRASWDRRIMQDGSGRSSMCLNNGSRSNSNVQKLLSDDGQASEEWVAQVEPGVMITLVALPDGSNQLKRIRFSQELFNKWQAQLWWAENSDMVYELYSITKNEAPCGSPSSSCSTSSRLEDALRNTPEMLSRANSALNSPVRISDHNIGISFPTTLTPSALHGGLFSPSSSSHLMDHHLDHHDHHRKVHGGDGHDHHHDQCNTKLESAPLILSQGLSTIAPFTFPGAISSSSSSLSSHHHKANVECHHLMEDPSPCHDIVEHHHLTPSLFVQDPSSCDDIVDHNNIHHHLTSSSYMKDQDPSYCDDTTNALPQEPTSSTITTTSASPHDGLSPTPSNTCELLEGASGAGKEGDDDEEEEEEEEEEEDDDDDGGDENEASSGAAGGVRKLKRVRLNKQPPN